MNYQPTDLLLLQKEKPVSAALAWWIHGEVSHCISAIRPGVGLDITWPRPREIDLATLRDTRIIHLRLAVPLDASGLASYARKTAEIWRQGYDLKSWGGWLTGRGSQAHRRINCAEGALQQYQAAGRFLSRSEHLISPQSFLEFAHAGAFTIISDRRF